MVVHLALLKRNRGASPSSGFTLVELLVVIAVIGVLVALMLPAIQSTREAARKTQCSNNLKQIGLGIHGYLTEHGAFPPGYVSVVLADHDDGGPGWSWSAQIMSFIEEVALSEQVDFDEPIKGAAS